MTFHVRHTYAHGANNRLPRWAHGRVKEWMNTFLQPIGDVYISFIYEDIPSAEHGSEWDGEVAVFVA